MKFFLSIKKRIKYNISAASALINPLSPPLTSLLTFPRLIPPVNHPLYVSNALAQLHYTLHLPTMVPSANLWLPYSLMPRSP